MITVVPRTGSTNADLLAMTGGGEPWTEGHWLVADRQEAGRGRMGRAWSDGVGNFMGSTLVRPGPHDPPPFSLALMAGLALFEAVAAPLRAQALRASLKWPNDLLVNGAKLAGILLESQGDAVIVGIGVNLASAPVLADRATVSLTDLGVAIERDAFAGALDEAFAIELQRWRMGGLAPMLRRWHSAAHPVGTGLKVQPPGEEALEGTFAGLTPEGNLRLTLADGSTRTIHAGDVFLT